MSQSEESYLVITELFLPTKGGTAVWFDEVYRQLGKRHIHIVTADVPGADEHDRQHPNVVHRLKLRRYAWLRPESLAIYGKFLLTSLAAGLSHRFDAVHAGRVLPEGLVGWFVARLIGKPLVIYAHGEELTTWRQSAKMRTMAFTFRRADLVIANSEFTRGQLLRLEVRADRIAVLHPGVDVERFRPGLPCADLRARIGMEAQQKLIVSVGRLSRRKGFDQVIRCLPELLKRGVDARHVIIGVGDDREYLATLARETGVADRVLLVGAVTTEELPRWYNAADVVAMPNRDIDGDTEGFGMVFIEAAACGKPALAGMAGGTGAAVIDGVTGLRVDGASIDAIAEALVRLLDAPDLARALGENGHRRAVADLSRQKVAERTRDLHARFRDRARGRRQ
jgi:phosphatidylinositol alpha-1,6-mannosyltransferase